MWTKEGNVCEPSGPNRASPIPNGGGGAATTADLEEEGDKARYVR